MTESDAIQRGGLARSLLFQTGFVVSGCIWGLFSLLTAPFPYRWRYWFITRWSVWIDWWLRVSCKLDWEVEGKENIPTQAGVLMVKHQSVWETIHLQRCFSPQTWVLKRELLWVPLFGWALALLRPIAIDRSAAAAAVRQMRQQGRERLADGLWVVIFPEGTRVPPGCKARYHVGGAMLACDTGVAVVPVAHNAGEHWPRRGLRIHPGRIRVRIGPAISVRGKTAGAVAHEVEAWIEAQMPSLSRSTYSGEPYHRAAARRQRQA